MRPAEQIKHMVKSGAMGDNEAQTELLLDIRHLAALALAELKQIVAQTKKPGRPRKKKADSA